MKAIIDKIGEFFKKQRTASVLMGIILLCGVLGYQSYSNNKLIDQVNTQHDQIIELNKIIDHDNNQISVLVSDSQSTYKEVKKLKSEVASLLRRMDEVQQYQLDQALNQKRDDDSRPSFDDINTLQSQLSSLQFQIKDVNQKIYELNKLAITSTINKQTQSNQLPNNATNAPEAKPSTKPVLKPLSPPFTVLGIESRGGEMFASIAPSHSKSYSLSQVKLLRIGDSYKNWHLRNIKNNAVVFNVGTRQQVITIR